MVGKDIIPRIDYRCSWWNTWLWRMGNR